MKTDNNGADKNEVQNLTARAKKIAEQRFGFMKGQIKVPLDFDTMMRDEIEEMFYGKPLE
jgi:hypothetical protein